MNEISKNIESISIDKSGSFDLSRATKKVWTIEKFREGEKEPYAVEVFEGNLLLNVGITRHLNLMAGVAVDPFSNTLTMIGVGSSNTAESASQTNLQASLGFADMDATYPQISGQTITFKSTFGTGVGTGAWHELGIATVLNGFHGAPHGDINSTHATFLNRKVADKGTKAAGDSWVVTYAITFS